MTDDIDEAIDWQGHPVACDPCAHRGKLATGGCQPMRACVHDRYARRIDRFFDFNPALAGDYLGHPHFEVRAIAAKYAHVFRLPALLADPDETVRWNAVRRLPRRYLLPLRQDPHREVRIRVASLLDVPDLTPMVRDADYYVRLVVARRLAEAELVLMMDDAEPDVRRVVAARIGYELLWRMADDRDAGVRLAIAQRLSPNELIALHADPDWRVRYEAASRIPADALPAMLADADEMVRLVARTRLELAEVSRPTAEVRPFGGPLAPSPRNRTDEALR